MPKMIRPVTRTLTPAAKKGPLTADYRAGAATRKRTMLGKPMPIPGMPTPPRPLTSTTPRKRPPSKR